MLTPEQAQAMTKEQIEKEAEQFATYDGENSRGVPTKCINPDKQEGYVTAAIKYAALLEEKDKEIERLRNWKIEGSYLLNPILEYGQGHKEIPIGGSITEHVLSWAKRYHEQKVELARLTTEAEQSLLLYNNMTATIVKRDEEIERLKSALQEIVSLKDMPYVDSRMAKIATNTLDKINQ